MRTTLLQTHSLTIYAVGKHSEKRINKTQKQLVGDFLIERGEDKFEAGEIIAEKKDRLDGYPCKPFWEYQL